MHRLLLILLLLPHLSWAGPFPGEFSGEGTLEQRSYIHKGAYENTRQDEVSLVLKPQYRFAWEQNRKVFTVIPYARISQVDERRSHIDLRELKFASAWDAVELTVGVGKVFWGVTESVHLVDVINQTDFVDNPDGEDKLGQLMVNPMLVSDYGIMEFFLLPHFRERTFPGNHGRFRGQLVVDDDNAIYLHRDKQSHLDYALRWSHGWSNLEWGLAYFKGTDREPGFQLDSSAGRLFPVYGQSRQFSLDGQWTIESWLLKLEWLNKNSRIHGEYAASAGGFEYTFSNIYQGMDIGLLIEWLYDERGENTQTGWNDTSFFGTRIALNNANSTELLLAGFIDNQSESLSMLKLEASGRINQYSSWQLEYNLVASPAEHTVIWQFKRDDYLQFSLSWYL